MSSGGLGIRADFDNRIARDRRRFLAIRGYRRNADTMFPHAEQHPRAGGRDALHHSLRIGWSGNRKQLVSLGPRDVVHGESTDAGIFLFSAAKRRAREVVIEFHRYRVHRASRRVTLWSILRLRLLHAIINGPNGAGRRYRRQFAFAGQNSPRTHRRIVPAHPEQSSVESHYPARQQQRRYYSGPKVHFFGLCFQEPLPLRVRYPVPRNCRPTDGITGQSLDASGACPGCDRTIAITASRCHGCK